MLLLAYLIEQGGAAGGMQQLMLLRFYFLRTAHKKI
jgi:hypothetical protein